jgi:ureidoglycolate hydrolase
MRVRLEELDESSFHEFGQILATPGKTWRKDFAANLTNRRLTAAPPNLALIRAEAAAFPLTIDELERHEHSSQAFLPLDVREYMVIVCKDNAMARQISGRCAGSAFPVPSASTMIVAFGMLASIRSAVPASSRC